MTMLEVMAQVASGKIKPEEALKLMPQPKATGMVVKFNKSGGVYIKHPKFVAHSAEKAKDYVAGINLDASVARVLFGDKAVYDEIAAAVMSLE